MKLTKTPQNREEINAKNRARYWANPEKAREACHRWARANKKKVNLRIRRWQKRMDPAQFSALQKQYRANARTRACRQESSAITL